MDYMDTLLSAVPRKAVNLITHSLTLHKIFVPNWDYYYLAFHIGIPGLLGNQAREPLSV